MQNLPVGILESLTPYSQFLWLIPAAIIGYIIGWRVRNSGAKAQQKDHLDAIQSRDLRLRTFQGHLDTRDNEIVEHKQQFEQEKSVLLADLQRHQELQEELKSTIGKTNTELAESNRINTRQQRQFADERTRLEQKITLLDQQCRSSEAYADRFAALKAKYKQMDARRSREIVEVRAESIELKKEQITLQEDRDKHLRFVGDMQTDLERLNNEHTHLQTILKSTRDEVGEREQNIRDLKKDLTRQSSEFNAEKQALLSHSERAEQLEASLAQKDKSLAEQQDELSSARKQVDSLLARIQELSDTNQQQLQEYEQKRDEVSKRLTIIQDESGREIKTLHKRLEEIGSLRTVNKNQGRSIERLETQLKDVRKRASDTDLQHREAQQTIAELTKSLDAETQSRDKQREQNAELLRELETNRQLLAREQSAGETLGRQLTEAREVSSDLEAALEEQQKLLAIETGNAEKVEQLSETLSNKENKIAGLIAQTERLKSIEEVATRTAKELADAQSASDKLQTELKQKIETLTSTEQQLSKLRETSEQQEQRQEQQITQLNSQLSEQTTLTDSLNTKEQDLSKTQAELQQLQKTSESQLRERDTEINQLSGQLKSTTQQLKSAEAGSKRAASEAKAFKQQKQQFVEEKEALIKQHAHENDTQTRKFTEQLETLNTKLGDQESKTQQLERSLSEKTATLGGVESRVATQKEKILSLQSSLDSLEKHNAELQRDASELDTLRMENQALAQLRKSVEQVKPLRESLDLEKTNNAQLSESNETLKNQNGKLKSSNESLIRQIDTHKTELSAQKSLSSEKHQKLKELEEKIVHLTKERNELKKLQPELDKSLAEQKILNDQLKDASTAQTESERALKDASRQLAILNEIPTELAKSRREIDRLAQALDVEKQARLEQETAKKAALAKTEGQIKQLTAMTSQYEEQEKQLKQELTETLNEFTSLQKQATDNGKALAAAQQKLAEGKEVVSALDTAREKISAQENSIKALQAELDTEKASLSKEKTALQKATEMSEQSEVQINKLKKEVDRFRILEASVQDRQKDILRLQTELEKLAALEQQVNEKDQEIKKLKTLNQQIKERDSKISELNLELDNLRQGSVDAQGTEVDLTRLRSEVQSLTRERDLGLERVRELSELSVQLTDRDKVIRQLKSEIVDSRVNARELETLRSRLQKQELDSTHKSQVIDDLKKMLTQHANKPLKPAKAKTVSISESPRASNRTKNTVKANATGPAVAKTSTTRSATASSGDNRRNASLAAIQKDDLKKIRGIGPVLEKTLNRMGITSFIQIASFSDQDIERITEELDTFPGRIQRDNWIGGAQEQHEKKYGK